MKTAWFILLISAFTDFVIVAGTSLTTAMLASGKAEIPTPAILIVVMVGGLIAMARTIQQAIKAEVTDQTQLVTSPVSSTTTVQLKTNTVQTP